MNIKEIVKQLESCKYKCDGGFLENNIAFIALKEMSKREYATDRYIGEIMHTEAGERVIVKNLIGEYDHLIAGHIHAQVCKDIYQKPKTIDHTELLTQKEQQEKEVRGALDVLKKI